MDNIIMAVYPVQSEAYQAFSELRRAPGGEGYLVSQAVLIEKGPNGIETNERLDTGVDSTDDTYRGSLIGTCVGVLGGPVGMLLGMGLGGLAGAALDAGDVLDSASLLEKIASKLKTPSVAILALVHEEKAGAADPMFSKFGPSVSRYDAAAVQEEIEEAAQAQKLMADQARSALRAERGEARKKRVEEIRQKITSDFEGLKKRFDK